MYTIDDVRIALDQINKLLAFEHSVGYYYNVPIGSPEKNTDCQIYKFSQVPPTSLNVSLLHGLDCTLAAEIILQYTSVMVDMQEEAKRRGSEIENMTEEELLGLYSSTRYFNTAILYAFHELKGPGYEHDVGAMGETWGRKAWPWGLTEAGVSLPAGGVVEYTIQPGDTWESISSTFIGSAAQGDEIAKINQKFPLNRAPVSGEKVYVPLDVERWVEVDMNEQSPEEVAEAVYGDKSFSEMVTRRCRARAGETVPKCVVPVFHDVKSVYEAFFAE
jgi:hypothetical protein